MERKSIKINKYEHQTVFKLWNMISLVYYSYKLIATNSIEELFVANKNLIKKNELKCTFRSLFFILNVWKF